MTHKSSNTTDRPLRKPLEEHHERVIAVYTTEEEYARITEASKLSGKSRAKLFREVIPHIERLAAQHAAHNARAADTN